MTLDETGLVTIIGDLTVTGTIASNSLSTNKITFADLNTSKHSTSSGSVDQLGQLEIRNSSPILSTTSNSDFHVQLATNSALLIQPTTNSSTQTLGASISASGSAEFATLSVRNNSGTATITAHRRGIIIQPQTLTQASQVIVTFEGDFAPATRYWITKDLESGAFSINLNQPVNRDTKAYWLIIN